MNLVVQLQKFGIILAKILPLKISDKIATGLGFLYCLMSKKKRDYIRNNLMHVFNNKKIAPERFNFYVKRTFINFARTMVDFFRLGFILAQDFDVEVIGFENPAKALKLKKGCVLLTLHLGNWDYAGSYLAAHGVPMSALVEETDTEMFSLYTNHRERLGMKTFPVTKAAYAFINAIKNNRVLAVLADRDITKNGITVNFFSGKRSIPKGLAEIIIKRKMPVMFGYMVLQPSYKKNRYLGVIETPFVFSGDADAFNKMMVKKYEEFIRCYPDQWFVFHPEWIGNEKNA